MDVPILIIWPMSKKITVTKLEPVRFLSWGGVRILKTSTLFVVKDKFIWPCLKEKFGIILENSWNIFKKQRSDHMNVK